MKKIFLIFLISLLISDLAYSFLQHYHQPMDGDMAGTVVPNEPVSKILNDPLGVSVFTENASYPNPNRFFCHWTYHHYFNSVPFAFQKITDPISSIYYSSALFKIILQISLLYIFIVIITGKYSCFTKEGLYLALIISPFLQTNGYQFLVGFIDHSITYTFFYIFPFILLMFYFLPFINSIFNGSAFVKKPIHLLYLIPFSLVICLSGPLNPGIILVFCFSLFILSIYKSGLSIQSIKTILSNKNYLIYFSPLIIFSIYSLILGSFNSENLKVQKNILEIYSQIPNGIFKQFTHKPALPLLIILILINHFFIVKFIPEKKKSINNLLSFILIFTFFYILLLPWGGYRSYRPHTVRFDTLLPITFLLILYIGYTSFAIINHIKLFTSRRWLLIPLFVIAIIFSINDKPEFYRNECEVQALEKIRDSREKMIRLDNSCTVLSWNKSENYLEYEYNCKMLQNWNITSEKKSYYFK